VEVLETERFLGDLDLTLTFGGARFLALI
jgi:hypothetical protein